MIELDLVTDEKRKNVTTRREDSLCGDGAEMKQYHTGADFNFPSTLANVILESERPREILVR